MSFSNVFIGNTANDGTGDALRTAFSIINQNFANLAAISGNANVIVYASGNANVTATYNPGVSSVAGRNGDVSLTVNDVIGAASIGYVNAMQANTAAIAANIAANLSTASVDANVAAANIAIANLTSDVAGLNSDVSNLDANAGIQTAAINSLNANIIAANLVAASLNSSINNLTANASVQAQLINLVNANVAAANAAIAAIGDVASINANVAAANIAISALQSNAATQAVSLNNLSAGQTAANASTANSVNLINANVAAANLAITALQGNATTQATAINALNSDITAANIEVASLRANAGAQGTLINIINANISAANLLITTLQSNADSQQSSIASLTANSATQESSISALRANITAANAAIAAIDLTSINANVSAANSAISVLQSNAGSQATAINSLNANIIASNVEVASLRANAGAQGALIISLQSNAAIQAAILDTLSGNAATQSTVLDTLTANAAAQSASLTALLANAVSQESSLQSLVSNAATQSDLINSVNANVTAANSAIAAQTVEVNNLRANITASNVEVISLRANAGVQGTLIQIVNANIAAANINISNLQNNLAAYQTFANANAAAQAQSLNTLSGNIVTINSLIELGNLAIANTANVQTDTVFIGNIAANNIQATNKIETESFIRVGPAHDQGQIWANPAALFFGNTSGQPSTYYQINLQNVDPDGSGDLVITADDGNDGGNFINLGINNSNYADVNYPGSLPHDGYVYITGGNLYITSANDNVTIGNVGSNVTITQNGFLHLTSANLKFVDNTVQTTAYNAAALSSNIGVLYDLFSLGNTALSTLSNNIVSTDANVAAANSSIITANTAMKNYVDQELADAIFVAGGYSDANVAAYLLNNTANVGNLITTGGVFWANGVSYSTGGGGGGSGTDDVLRANVGSYQIYANANAAAQATAIDTVNANIGSYQTYANATFSVSTYSNSNVASYLPTDSTIIGLQSNAAAQATAIDTVNANVGSYQIFANANAASQATSIDTINANVGAYQTYANATFSVSSYGDSNVKTYLGQFDGNIIPNANITYDLGSSTNRWRELWLSGNTINLGAATISANGTAVALPVGSTISGQQISVYNNSNVASYLPTDSTIIALQSNAALQASLIDTLSGNAASQGGVLLDLVANAATQANTLTTLLGNAATQATELVTLIGNAATQSGAITDLQSNATTQATALNSIDANVGAYQIYANTQIGSVSNTIINIDTSLGSLTNSVDAYKLYANTAIDTTNANIGSYQTFANANAATQATSINTVNANIGSYQTFANANAATQATSINTINANLGSFQSYANSTFSASSYGNTQVAAYLPSYTGNVSAGNVRTTTAVSIGSGNTTATVDYVNGNLRISAGYQFNVIPPTAYSLESPTDFTLGDLIAGVNGNFKVMRATVSGGWSSNATTAFGLLTTSASNLRVRTAGVGNSVFTTLTSIEYFAGNTAYILTFVDDISFLSNWNVDRFELTVSSTTNTKDDIVFYTGGKGNDELLRIDGDTKQITTFGNIIPGANITYDLGSPTNRWRDLWLSGNTINIGDKTISSGASGIVFDSNISYIDNTRYTVTGIYFPQTGVPQQDWYVDFEENVAIVSANIGPFTGNTVPFFTYWRDFDQDTGQYIGNGNVMACIPSQFTLFAGNSYLQSFTFSAPPAAVTNYDPGYGSWPVGDQNQWFAFDLDTQDFVTMSNVPVLKGYGGKGVVENYTVELSSVAQSIDTLTQSVTTANTQVAAYLDEVNGNIVPSTGSTANVTQDLSLAKIFYHSNVASNFTANFINVSTTDNKKQTVELIIEQGLTPNIANLVQINGTVETIKWDTITAPTGTASNVDVITFDMIRVANTWTVLGSLTSYGSVPAPGGGGGGGGGGDIVGTMTVGNEGGNYGYGSVNPVIGSMTQNPTGIIQGLVYSAFGGGLSFNSGSYTGPNGSITVGYGTLNGSGSLSLTLDGITRTINFDGMSWSDSGADHFGLINKVGQTLNFSITIL